MRLISRVLFVLAIGALTLAPLAELHAVSLAGPRLTAPVTSTGAGATALSFLAAAAALGMAIRIKDTGSIARKFVQRAGVAGNDYAEGVKAAGGDWETNTKASEENYKIGVQQAAADGRFGRGVAAAGASKYVDKASTLGAQRYPTGVAAAEGAYSRGVQPHLDMMKSLDLPPRRPKGDPANQQRAAVVAAANRKLKIGK